MHFEIKEYRDLVAHNKTFFCRSCGRGMLSDPIEAGNYKLTELKKYDLECVCGNITGIFFDIHLDTFYAVGLPAMYFLNNLNIKVQVYIIDFLDMEPLDEDFNDFYCPVLVNYNGENKKVDYDYVQAVY